MEKRIALGFTPPYVVGLDGEFNTFRLGSLFAKVLEPGKQVFLMDERTREVFGTAEVKSIERLPLGEACLLYGKDNHTQLDQPDEGCAERIFNVVRKIYGPHIATPEKKCVVIHMKRLE